MKNAKSDNDDSKECLFSPSMIISRSSGSACREDMDSESVGKTHRGYFIAPLCDHTKVHSKSNISARHYAVPNQASLQRSNVQHLHFPGLHWHLKK